MGHHHSHPCQKRLHGILVLGNWDLEDGRNLVDGLGLVDLLRLW